MESKEQESPGVAQARSTILGDAENDEACKRLQYLIYYLFNAARDIRAMHSSDLFKGRPAQEDIEFMRQSLAPELRDDPFYLGVLCSLLALISHDLEGNTTAINALVTLNQIANLLKKPALGSA